MITQNICSIILGSLYVVWVYGSWAYNFICLSVPITTKVVSSNPVHGEVYTIQQYLIKFISDMWQVGGFLRVYKFPPPIN